MATDSLVNLPRFHVGDIVRMRDIDFEIVDIDGDELALKRSRVTINLTDGDDLLGFSHQAESAGAKED